MSQDSPPRDRASRDRLFTECQPDLADFAFDERVAAVFPDMIRRSVPGYADLIANLGPIAARYAQTDSRIYDLGCSLGAASLSMRARVRAAGCRIVAVDNSAAMLERAAAALAAQPSPSAAAPAIDFQLADLRDLALPRASVVVLNFTLQFLPPADRDALLARIRSALLPGGALLLAEKLAFDDPREQALFDALHADFKRANGYSALEIAQKRSALERVMIPESAAAHRDRLRRAGFERVHCWQRCLNFAAWLAIAGESR